MEERDVQIPVPTMAEMAARGESPEILFWVGCAGSFDDRAKKVSKTLVRILHRAGVSFAILGNEESCSGDPARRAGNEFLFQMLALQNIGTLDSYGIKRIVTACPHCFNTLRNEYPALGGNYEVIHHTQLINALIKEGRIEVDGIRRGKVTYHDSCFLGRANDEYEAPREIIEAINQELVEMRRSGSRGLCCGAGGAQMFKEDEPGDKRINEERIDEVIETGAQILAANCPFCLTMLEDGVKSRDDGKKVMVYDLSELVLNQMR